jgi:hypothetical protein
LQNDQLAMVNSQWKRENSISEKLYVRGPNISTRGDLLGVCQRNLFSRLIKNGPAYAEASAGRQMQVELCEIPFAGGFRSPESGVATNKERLPATPASW